MIKSLTPSKDVEEKLQKFGFKTAETIEARKGVYVKSGYPTPIRRYRLDFESPNHNVEEMYYWMVSHARDDFDHPMLKKIIDTHAQSTASSAFADLQTRLSAQQSAVSNYMGMMGKLIKDLFALVRELRQIEERLGYYTQSYDDERKIARQAEATLKDIWITLVEGGTNNPSSVYGMSQKVGFTILPDLFFGAPPLEKEKIDDYVESLDFNESVKKAVARKIFQFTNWKVETHKELKNKRVFQVRYLRQHFETVRMYMDWIKPYLRNIAQLQLDEGSRDDAFLINSFETTLSEIEVLAMQPAKKEFEDPKDNVYSVIMMSFSFRSKPSMDFHAKESWQSKGPIHIGRTEATIRQYVWTQDQIDKYKAYRDQESFEIVSRFDASVKDAMAYLGEDLERYLREAEVDIPEGMFAEYQVKKEDKAVDAKVLAKKQSAANVADFKAMTLGPFIGLFEMMIEPFTGSISFDKGQKISRKQRKILSEKESFISEERSRLKKWGSITAFNVFKNYKKAHKMVSW